MRNEIKVTEQWLKDHNACNDGMTWFLNQKATSLRVLVGKLITQSKFDWANWVLVRFMTHEQNVQYACLSALESLKNFESVYPNDKRPREAIQAALKWVLNPTNENKSAAEAAAWSAAWSAAEAAAWSAAWSAVEAAESAAESAAWSARSAAESAAWSAKSAVESAESAAWSARSAVEAAESAAKAWKKILVYGLKIVFKESIKHFFTKGLK